MQEALQNQMGVDDLHGCDRQLAAVAIVPKIEINRFDCMNKSMPVLEAMIGFVFPRGFLVFFFFHLVQCRIPTSQRHA